MSKPTIVRNGRGYKDVIANTVARTGQTWTIIQSVNDSTAFTELLGDIDDPGPSTLPKGMILEGEFTTIELSAGEVIAYRKP
jgi:hypothetical protein